MKLGLLKVFTSFRPTESPDLDSKAAKLLPNPNHSYLGGQAIVTQTIQPLKAGRVQFQGSWWPAWCEQRITINPGEVVDVAGIHRNITLLVEPALLLRASSSGLTRINQAVSQKGWWSGDRRPIEAASKILIPDTLTIGMPSQQAGGISAETWDRFLQAKPINVNTFKAYCEVLELDWKETVGRSTPQPASSALITTLNAPISLPGQPPIRPEQSLPESNLVFVGRAGAIADLDNLVNSGAKVIVIQGSGGLGKTTLARQYFNQKKFGQSLECWMAKETRNLTSAQSIVQEWLRRNFNEEPGREFGVSLERLRRKLKTQKVSILIDNLEPALDKNGKFVESHRDYAELLRVLADPEVNSVTLITSREPVHEASVNVQPYILPGLEEEAWGQFFSRNQINVNFSVLKDIHTAYRGNAKAMTILSSIIQMDYAGDLEAYWKENSSDLLVEVELENLVASHFSRLQQLYPEAYRLLYRLGCYRYQRISRMPIEAVACLLWDVPPEQHRRVIRFLRDLFLIELIDGEYRLHPTIQAKALEILKASGEWEIANLEAAEFWTHSVKAINTPDDAFRALEAYYHYLQTDRVELAADVILYARDNRWGKNEPLGVSFYRLGLLQQMVSTITRIIDRVKPGYSLSKLHNILGDLYWISGDIHRAIRYHQESRRVAIALKIKELEIVSLYNIGLCQIDLWEVEEAAKYFKAVISLAEGTDFHRYAVTASACLAFLTSCSGMNQLAIGFAKKVYTDYSSIRSSRGKGYSLIFLGQTHKNLGELEKAHKMYSLAKTYAEESHYTQVKANALKGLGELYLIKGDFKGAIAHLLAAKKLLIEIEAKADLAEVHYQLGLTCRAIGSVAESEANFRAAIQLFQKIPAPKQVEKVQRAARPAAAS
ncbi:MAG: hypothetical protein HC879_06050 [Leptolyngbyaceae cyanobacterium SL_5_9]|nr:hypothetical protein [Leptolyngbyaceae cyanobacterium SL_5_9]